MIALRGDEPNAVSGQMVIDNCRVEGADDPASRLIHVNNTYGLNRLRLSSVTWPIKSDYLIELEKDLIESDLWLPGLPGKLIRVNPGAQIRGTRFYGPLAGKIQVEPGASAVSNTAFSSDGNAFVGGNCTPTALGGPVAG